MGGQACVFYGAAEFSRDADLVVLSDAANLRRLEAALAELQAQRVAVPPFSAEYLERGHAVHFRCRHPDAEGIRVDIMSKLRGVDDFPALWERRTTLADDDGTVYELVSLPDLVQAKKTQRGKDWPMIQRLLEANYLQHRAAPTPEQRGFWLRELRTPELLVEAASQWPGAASRLVATRPLLGLARSGREKELAVALADEDRAERERDREYWQPLKTELERLRHDAARKN